MRNTGDGAEISNPFTDLGILTLFCVYNLREGGECLNEVKQQILIQSC